MSEGTRKDRSQSLVTGTERQNRSESSRSPNEVLEEMKIDGPAGTDQSPMQADHAEDSAAEVSIFQRP